MLFIIQSFRGCHRADIHPEHVHSIRRPGALWMCHLCEDITRAGGGTDAQFAHHNLTFKTLKNDASLSSRELNSTPNEIVLTFLCLTTFYRNPPFILDSLAFLFALARGNKAYYEQVPFTILYTIVRLVHKQHKTLNSEAYVCWFSWLKQLRVHIETCRTKEVKNT